MPAVVTGLERFLEAGSDRAGIPRKARIGLLVHPASVDRRARHALDLVLRAGGPTPVRLFAAEHGVRGEAQDMVPVGGGSDPETGLPVRSLYGSTADSLRPDPADLEDLDAIVFDLQDVGSRYYTFAYTLSLLMESARDAGTPVVVLDRPNPIGGTIVEGPVLDPSLASFVGRYPLPVRHAMTVGELARMFNEEFGIGCDLRVVSMRGWRRGMHHEDTGLPWVAPSPNMPSPDTARVYPGACLIEGTNLSEGRGTTRPFELVGAPWIRSGQLAADLEREGLPGVRFRTAAFQPMFQKHAGRTCNGVQIHVTDRDSFRPFATYLVLIREALRQDREAFRWRTETYEFETDRLAIDLLLGRTDLRPMVEALADLAEMEASWASDLARFRPVRERFLIYPD